MSMKALIARWFTPKTPVKPADAALLEDAQSRLYDRIDAFGKTMKDIQDFAHSRRGVPQKKKTACKKRVKQK